MILVIDVGNTNVVLGTYKNDLLMNSWRMSTITNRTADETGVFIISVLERSGFVVEDIESCIISSVVPDIMYSLTHGIQKYFDIEPLVVSSNLKMKITFDNFDNPKEFGSDRIVNCEAAYDIYGGPAIVIDYGTATTYDVIDASGQILTAITSPGIKISADALNINAALLGKVQLVLPKSIVVKNTTESVQAGLIFGHIGETEYIVNKLKKDLNIQNAKVIGTGGLATVISNGTDIFDVIDKNLTLEGLLLLHKLNTKG